MAIARDAGYLPSDLAQRIVFLSLSGQWDACETCDLDGTHLRSASTKQPLPTCAAASPRPHVTPGEQSGWKSQSGAGVTGARRDEVRGVGGGAGAALQA